MQKKRQVQIDYDLFLNCYKIICGKNFDDAELMSRTGQALNTKFEQMKRRQLYTQYKTASTAEEKELARQSYLDERGVHKDFRW